MIVLHSLRSWYRNSRIHAGILFFILLYVVFLIKLISLINLSDSLLYLSYGLAISFYVFIRFSFGYFYNPVVIKKGKKIEPTITFGIPAKNEGVHIRETIETLARVAYPKKKFSIIAIDDGSTDNTYAEMVTAQKQQKKRGIAIEVIKWKTNKGKRAGMAEIIRRAKSELVLFIDSDSFLEKHSVKTLVRYFVDPAVGAVAGHAYVANTDKNILTRMQAARYYIAFRAYKAAEALFGTVTCCSGCCAAYRRSYIIDIISDWEKEMFLGTPCTYGDDRSLTNILLQKGYQTLYAPDVISHTLVPESLRVFMNQQLRWKKSWFRETLRACTFMWKRHIFTSSIFYLGFILTMLAPFFVFRALVWVPITTGRYPFQYLGGLILMSVVYSVYYYLYTKDKQWVYEVLFSALYTVLLIWQLPWAILTIRDSRWGTR